MNTETAVWILVATIVGLLAACGFVVALELRYRRTLRRRRQEHLAAAHRRRIMDYYVRERP